MDPSPHQSSENFPWGQMTSVAEYIVAPNPSGFGPIWSVACTDLMVITKT